MDFDPPLSLNGIFDTADDQKQDNEQLQYHERYMNVLNLASTVLMKNQEYITKIGLYIYMC
jgi:hypothetical protein